MKRRVVVTGVGLITPVAVGTEETWNGLVAGKSGIGPITHFDHAAFATHFAGEVKGFDPLRWITSRETKSIDPFIQYAIGAASLAMEDSGLKIEPSNAERVGCFVGAGLGGVSTIEATCRTLAEKGPRHGISPFFVPMIIVNLAPGQISIRFGAKGPNLSQVSACSTGAHAIGDAFRVIQRGDADAMICGGTEAGITRVGIAGFGAMRALSRRNDDPKRASRPFDAGRDGFVMGEAGGAVVLEEFEHAKARGAKIYAELIGYGVSSDANHVTEPDPAGTNPARAMTMAFGDAGIDPSEIGYINAHGTSTPLGDTSETRVIKVAVGEENARKIPISSTKGATGHCLGAAGAVEAIFTILATQRGVLPPTINYENEDPSCDLDYIPNESRQADITVGVSNSFGFGGHNACIVFRKLDGG